MADELPANTPSPSPMYAGAAEEANLKKLILKPSQLDEKYYEDVTKDLSTSFIPANVADFYLGYIALTKSSVNLALHLELLELAVMEQSELSTDLAALASVDGFRIKNLGSTTGYSRSDSRVTTTTESDKNVQPTR